MSSRCLWTVGLLIGALGAPTVGTDPTRQALAREIGFVEEFALATDRAAPLAQLIPGTEDYYYYHCLHYQNTEQYQRVEETLKAWIKRYKYTARVHEIINRQALLTFPKNPQKTLAHLQHRLGLRFDHQRQLLDRKPNLPTRLDQDLISRETLTKRALARHKNLQGFEPAAHDWLIATELNADRRRHLLSQLQRPDHANLPKLVVDDLNYRHSRGFGSFPIHGQLLLSQLKASLKLKPDLLNQGKFVNTYLARLQPHSDVDWRNDPVAYEAYLDRLWAFVKRLAPVHNSLKAHVLYHRLVHDRGQDVFDADRFMTYLKLPRPLPYVEPRYLQREESRRYRCNLNADFRSVTMLPPVGNDEPLVRSYLMHFFVEAANYDAYRPYVRDDYLKHAFAETKIVNGLGDPEQWYSLLPPAVYQQLKERVDLDFAHTSRKLYAPDEPVSLDLFVKNVETLIVKVFEINTGNFYRDQQREIDTDVNLDGLVANQEKTHTYTEPPLRRVRRHFEFPQLNRRGVYVIDFIGNGKSSRALIRKGRLRHLVRTSTAGHVFTVLDQQNQKLSDAKLWLAGREYTPDKQGLITVPFSNQPRRQTIVLTHGDFSSIDAFAHQSEKYELQAAIFVDRESLISRRTSRVLIRPSLRVSGVPVAPSVLEEVKLRITSTDQDGVSTSQEIADFPLHVDQESTHDFQVPQRLAKLSVQLSAKVQNLTQNKKIDLSARQEFVLNQIDRQANTAGLHFQQIDGAYAIDVLGKSGEPLADRPVQLTVKHRDFRQPVHVSLQSGPRGRVALGQLEDIVWVKATGPAGTSYTWNLRHDAHTYPATIDARARDTVALPYMGPEAGPRREQLSLLELRGERFVADRFPALEIKNGMLQIRDLPAGDYDLLIKRSGTRIRIRLAEGEDRERYVLGGYRLLERRGDRPLQIENIKVGENDVTVKLRNANKATRLHVFAVRYEPAYAPFGYLGRIRDVGPAMRILPAQPSQYIAGRNIGDEYRYIIDRKYAKKYPGNMLTRPSLLLNPWPIRSTEAGAQEAQEGGGFGSGSARYGGKAGRRAAGAAAEAASTDFASLDFLDQGSAVLVNLRPDEAGVVRIDRELIGSHQKLQFVAVDPLSTTYRSLSLPEVPRKLVDLRLIVGLDPARHFTQQKQITLVDAKQTLEVAVITSTRLEPYDSLARVYALYMTLSRDSKLAEFAFVMNWHKLNAEEKRQLYSEYACHELNFFLMKKDPAFFREAIVPYLKNKKDKTFLDQWLLEEKLDKYLLPWNHAGLNIVERILLGQRIAGERPRTARHVTDLYDLIPPDLTRFNYLFNTAVQGRQLQVGGQLGWDKAVKQALERRRQEAREKGILGDLNVNGISPRNTTDEAAPDVALSPATPGSALGGKPGDRPRKAAEKASGAAGVEMSDLEEEIEDLGEHLYFKRDAERRSRVRRLYIKLDKTQEWVENNYFKLPIAEQNADLVTVNSFWNDFAAHNPTRPFYS
ncbi:MAG: hypothetical protein OES79_07695, partial [Planctomycetota bacterium]|nr:hypothetical protein [Planctomycetota bacterium]